MKHIFYFVAIAFIIHQMIWILKPKFKVEKIKSFETESKKNKDKKWEEYSSDYKQMVIDKGSSSLLFTFWMFAGLLTFNWPVFLSILVFNFAIVAPISKLTKYSLMHTVLHWINSIIGFAFGVFVIVNSYHLKIDIYEWMFQWLN